jgi:inositol transport system permease protein
MDMRPSYLAIGRGSIGIIPIPVIIFISLCVISHIILRKSKLGRHIYGIGGNEQAAVVCGINIKRVKMIVYTYAGMMVGIASIIMSARATVGAPAAGVGYEFDAITAVVLGGTSLSGGVGMIPKTVIGVLIIGVLNNGLTILGVSPYFQLVFKGLLITGAVVLDTLRYRGQ